MSTAQMLLGLEATAAKHADDIARLVPLAIELALRAGAAGVTIADLRSFAVTRGLLTGEERGKQLAYLGAVMKAAHLRPSAGYRRSHIDKSHGNLHRIYTS